MYTKPTAEEESSQPIPQSEGMSEIIIFVTTKALPTKGLSYEFQRNTWRLTTRQWRVFSDGYWRSVSVRDVQSLPTVIDDLVDLRSAHRALRVSVKSSSVGIRCVWALIWCRFELKIFIHLNANRAQTVIYSNSFIESNLCPQTTRSYCHWCHDLNVFECM